MAANNFITDFSQTAGSNTHIGSISVEEGWTPSSVNNAVRQLQAMMADSANGAAGWNVIQTTGTAGTTQTQAGALAITSPIMRISTCATSGDGVKLPTAAANLDVLIINDGAEAAQIWPNTSDAIDGGSADAVDANTLAAGSSRRYIAIDATNWYTASAAGFDAASPGAIGGTTPGSFNGTTGTFSGVLSVDDTTDSTSGTTGSIHTDGGLGVAKDLVVAGEILAADGAVGAPSITNVDDTDTGIYWPAANSLSFAIEGVQRWTWLGANVFFNDTANANMSQGFTINQGTFDNDILSLKSSDVAHAKTSWAETDTYAWIQKASAAVGGLRLRVVADSTYNEPFILQALGGNPSTGKSTGSNAGMVMQHGRHDGADGWTAHGDNANLFAIRLFNSSGVDVTQFIIDEDGDYHYNGADGGAFDKYDDADYARALQIAMSNPAEIIKNDVDNLYSANRAALVKARLIGDVTQEEWDAGIRPLVNGAQTQRLLLGMGVQQRAMFETMKKTIDEMVPGFGMKLANALKANNLPALT